MTDTKGRNKTPDQDSPQGLKLFEDSYKSFVGEHESAQLELTKRVMAAQHEFRMSQLGCTDGDSGSAAAEAYVEAVRSAWRASQDATKAAHDRCIDGLIGAWKGTPRDQLDPNGLIAIANGLAAIASQSAATSGNVDVFAATGVPPPEDAFPATSEPLASAS
jgi:hypothetical protein